MSFYGMYTYKALDYALEHVNRYINVKSYGRKATNRALARRKRLRGNLVVVTTA